MPLFAGLTISWIIRAVPQGTVDFSTMMEPLACLATVLVALSIALTSAMDPAPRPCVFVGVLTHMKII